MSDLGHTHANGSGLIVLTMLGIAIGMLITAFGHAALLDSLRAAAGL